MIALFASICIIGVFVSGYMFALHGFWACVMVGLFAMALGLLFAAAETRGFQGEVVRMKHQPYRWTHLWDDCINIALAKDQLLSGKPLYVSTDFGLVALTGVFSARINGENALVLDTALPWEENEEQYHAAQFNALKQGVM